MIARRMTGDAAPSSARAHPFIDWKGSTAARLQFLAAALETGSPAIFLDQIAWARIAFESRGITPDLLRLSLIATAEVLERELPERSGRAATELIARAIVDLDRESSDAELPLASQGENARLTIAYMREVLEGDRRAAADIIVRAVRESTSVLDAYLHIIAPAQAEIGRMWHRGEISVAEEHFATTTTHLVLSLLYPLLPRAASNGRVVVCGSVEGNAHDVGIRMVADCFEMDGWRSIHLGADVPAEDLGHAVVDYHAHALALSAGIATQLRPLRQTIEHLRHRAETRGTVIVVGGAAFGSDPLLWQTIGADTFAPTADLAPRVVADFLRASGR